MHAATGCSGALGQQLGLLDVGEQRADGDSSSHGEQHEADQQQEQAVEEAVGGGHRTDPFSETRTRAFSAGLTS